MKLASVRQMKEIDRISIEEFGIPPALLMENAGAAVARRARETGLGSFAVLCGGGSNGGDGAVAARQLFCAGFPVTVWYSCDPDTLQGDAKANHALLVRLGVPLSDEAPDAAIDKAECVIDALLGIGGRGAPRGEAARAVEAINRSGKPVVSVDIPTGLDADTGSVPGACVRAAKTVTFGVNKIGLALLPGAEYAGEVLVEDISFAPRAVERQDISVGLLTKADLPPRPRLSHKGTFGRVLAVCGSARYSGAAYLSTGAALRGGCGLVTLGVPHSLLGKAERLPEVITLPLADRDGTLAKEAIPALEAAAAGADAILCGCGLGTGEDIRDIVRWLVGASKVPLVLDADGINALIGHTHILKGKLCGIILTPHMGEMGRLTGMTAAEVQNNAVEVAKSFSAEYNVVTVLKGADTIIAQPDRRVLVSALGNSALATAGSGDVLAGLIAGFAAGGQKAAQAAANGVYIHAAAGRLAAEKLGAHGTIAGDILGQIPYAIREEVKSNGGAFVSNMV